MTCQDDATLTGPVSLFLGIETATWTVQQFQDTAKWARSRGISTLFIKCAEVGSPAGGTSGWWYGGQSGFDAIYLAVSPIINVIPYIFPYGNTYGALTQEVTIAKALMQAYGKLCLDMEQSYWVGANGALWAKSFADVLAPMPGKLWLSHPANPVESNQLPFMAAMSKAVNIFMPMVYNDYLATKWQGDLAQINPQACIQPTLDLSQEFGANNVLGIAQKTRAAGILAVSLWYEGFARTNLGLVDQIVTLFGGTPVIPPPIGGVPVTTNSKGEVADFPDVSQMEPGESEMACGFFAVGECKFAGPPGKGPTGTPEQLDQWADAQGGLNTEGVSIEDMHNLFKAAGLHYWDTDIAPGTVQSHDIATIKAALARFYPVVATVAETSVFDMNLQGNPYSPNWTPSGNHVFTYTGIASDGNLLVHDTANIIGGIFGKIAPQPRRYQASSLENHWAAIVQLPWLPPIPNGDPLSWPPVVAPPVPPPTPPDTPPLVANQQKQFQDIWNASAFLFPGGVAPSYTSGIANEWKTTYMPRFFLGPPMSPEFHTVDWTGKDIIVQLFLNGVCQYTMGQGGRWWLGNMEITMK